MQRGSLPRELLLVMSHATRAEYDHLVVLHRSGDRFAGTVERVEDGRWYLEITPRDRSWRLKGTLQPDGDGRLDLLPATGP